MNEFYNTKNTAAKIRKTLLATASAVVLAAQCESAQGSDIDRPTVWIEGGSQFESVTGENDPFVPPLDAYSRALGFTSLTRLEKALGRTYGGEGSVSFQPNGSDWVFTASARYGRAQTTRRVVDQKNVVGQQMLKGFATAAVPTTPSYEAYGIGYSKNAETHALIDFQVGRDVGVGLLGQGTDSVISFGARYAQMSGKSKAHSYAVPDVTFVQGHITLIGRQKYSIRSYFQRSHAFVERTDSLHALGPSLSMKNTTGLLGIIDKGQLALDWGVNAALLFGRQKAKTSHHSTIAGASPLTIINRYQPVTRSRSRMAIVPNVGGFAGLSYRFPNAKISAGYRADFFFGAKDSGLETRSTTDVSFHGPYATISIGLGG